MKKQNIFSMALCALMATATLTSCEGAFDDIFGEWDKPSGGAVTPSGNGTPTVDDVIKYGFKVTDLAGNDKTTLVTSLKMSTDDGPIAEAEVSDGKITIKADKLSGITTPIDFWFEAEIGGKNYMAMVNIDPTTLSPETLMTLKMATIGDWILGDGTFVVKGTTGGVAVIAYVGKVDKYFDRFLAIARTDADANKQTWENALTMVDTYAYQNSITIAGTTYKTGTTGVTLYDKVKDDQEVSSATATIQQAGWRMPSVTDWRYVFDGLGRQNVPLTLVAKNSDGSTTYSTNATPTAPKGVKDVMYYYDSNNVSSLRTAINTACDNTALHNDGYWSSSELDGINTKAWRYSFSIGDFVYYDKTETRYVRAVFAY